VRRKRAIAGLYARRRSADHSLDGWPSAEGGPSSRAMPGLVIQISHAFVQSSQR
jgi:hypothetical protein